MSDDGARSNYGGRFGLFAPCEGTKDGIRYLEGTKRSEVTNAHVFTSVSEPLRLRTARCQARKGNTT